MNLGIMEQDARRLLSYACEACKPLLWLTDADSPQRLAPQLREPLREALKTINGYKQSTFVKNAPL